MILFTGGVPGPRGGCLVPRGGGLVPACLAGFQAHTQGGSVGGIWSGGGGLQAHSQGGSWGDSGPDPHPRGKLRRIWSRPTPKGEVEGDLVQASPCDGYCCGWYASYWNAFFFLKKFAWSLIPCLKARVGSFNCAWQRHICYMFPVIPLWCDTC